MTEVNEQEEGQMSELAKLFICPTCHAPVGEECVVPEPHPERVAPIWVVFNVGKAWGLRQARQRAGQGT